MNFVDTVAIFQLLRVCSSGKGTGEQGTSKCQMKVTRNKDTEPIIHIFSLIKFKFNCEELRRSVGFCRMLSKAPSSIYGSDH